MIRRIDPNGRLRKHSAALRNVGHRADLSADVTWLIGATEISEVDQP